MSDMPVVAIIGGTGFCDVPGLEKKEAREAWITPFGMPSSDKIQESDFGGVKVFFLNRHGSSHLLSPSTIPYQANIFDLKRRGVTHIIAVTAVGSLKERLAPGMVCAVTQILDKTKKRQDSFFAKGVVAHVPMADPVCECLTQKFLTVGNCYKANLVCIEGPQYSSRFESNLYRSWDLDLIGMTTATEAKLAREAEICYGALALVTDYDCWRTGEEVTARMVSEVMSRNKVKAMEIIQKVVPLIESNRKHCACSTVLDSSLHTPPEHIDPATRESLNPLLRRALVSLERAKTAKAIATAGGISLESQL